MPRGLVLALVFVSSACAAIWPGKLGDYQRKSASVPAPATDHAQAAEYGFEAGERGDYGPFQITGLEFKDVTGAYAASLDPANKDALEAFLAAPRCLVARVTLPADPAWRAMIDAALSERGGDEPL